LSSLYRRGSRALPAGTSFVVRVTNLDCNTVDPADPGPIQTFPPRSLAPRQLQQGRETTIYPPLPGDPSAYALLAFGDFNPANYELVITSNVPVNTWDVFDAPALEIANGAAIPANTPTSINFVVQDPAFAGWSIGRYLLG